MPSRTEVFSTVYSERVYQNAIWRKRYAEVEGSKVPDCKKKVESWLVYLRGYYNDAILAASHSPDSDDTLHIFRKLAGICTACLQACGGWERHSSGKLTPYCLGSMTMDDANLVIGRELDFQDTVWKVTEEQNTIDSFLLLFGLHLDEAVKTWMSHEAADYEVSKSISQLAAVAFLCMETHGAPQRHNVIGGAKPRAGLPGLRPHLAAI